MLREFVGVGGAIKQRPEDFFVQELPLYEASGDGEHVLAEIEKVGLSTFEAIDQLARQLKVDRRDIGYAGLKDAQAVTRQLVSIPRITPDVAMSVKGERLSVRWAAPHRSKLRLGHLKANAFAIKVRNVDPMRVVSLRPALDALTRRGMPNYFGEQRFGRRDNNDQLGAAFVRGDDATVVRLLLGDPRPGEDDPASLEARQYFAAGDLERSHKAWPHWARTELRVLSRLMKSNNPREAVMAVDMQIRRLWVTGLQSRLFNRIVARRIESIDTLWAGDLAYKHENGACFLVEQPETEQPRADAFEISPTGPMVGRRLSPPRGKPLEMERELFQEYGISPDDFRSSERDRSHGDRRPLRVQPTNTHLEAGVDEHGQFITVAFTLPPGSYATVLMRELMRVDAADDQTRDPTRDETR
ncbi:MAG: tRNA pseudouridine(13) synthase TruD [Tepidisphaeraceae bacterium]